MKATIYVLKSCDSCKKAIKALKAARYQLEIIDLRVNGVPEARLSELLVTHGEDTIINRKSTTWRGLDDATRNIDPLALLMAHPTLMKRPLTIVAGVSHIGWSKDIQAKFGL